MVMLQEKMSSRKVSLVWDGHHRTLVSVFEKLLESSSLVDCTIAAQGKQLKAHKEVLSAFSPFFELLFKEEHEKNPTVILDGVNFQDMKSLIDYMYHGKVVVTEDRVKDLIDVAQCLQIKGLGGASEEDVSGRTKTNSHFSQRQTHLSSVSHKRKRKNGDRVVESASSMNINANSEGCMNINANSEGSSMNINVNSKGSPMNINANSEGSSMNINANIEGHNYIRFLQHVFSVNVPTAHVARQTSSIQHLSTNFGESLIQSDPSGPNVSLSAQPMLSTEVNNLRVRDVSVLRMVPGPNENESIVGPVEVVNRQAILGENTGNFCDNIGEETILGLSADVSVMNNKSSDSLSTNYVPHNMLNSSSAVLTPPVINASRSRKQIGSYVNKELNEGDINLSSSVNRTVSATETQNILDRSGLNVKTEANVEKEILLLEGEDISEENDHSEEVAIIENVGDSSVSAVEMQNPHNVEKQSECSDVTDNLRPKTTTKMIWDNIKMKTAINAVREEKMSLRDAAKHFAVPLTTLWRLVKERSGGDSMRKLGDVSDHSRTIRKVQTWDKVKMKEAVIAVREELMTPVRAAEYFAVPRSTLRRLAQQIHMSPEEVVMQKVGRKSELPETRNVFEHLPSWLEKQEHNHLSK